MQAEERFGLGVRAPRRPPRRCRPAGSGRSSRGRSRRRARTSSARASQKARGVAACCTRSSMVCTRLERVVRASFRAEAPIPAAADRCSDARWRRSGVRHAGPDRVKACSGRNIGPSVACRLRRRATRSPGNQPSMLCPTSLPGGSPRIRRGIAPGLDDGQRLRIERQQHAMRLDESRNMDRFTVAICKVGGAGAGIAVVCIVPVGSVFEKVVHRASRLGLGRIDRSPQ